MTSEEEKPEAMSHRILNALPASTYDVCRALNPELDPDSIEFCSMQNYYRQELLSAFHRGEVDRENMKRGRVWVRWLYKRARVRSQLEQREGFAREAYELRAVKKMGLKAIGAKFGMNTHHVRILIREGEALAASKSAPP